MDPKLRKTTSNSFVFNSKKNNQLLPKKIRKKIEGLHYRDKITILAYDSEPKIKDVSKCKAIKCLSLRIGHNYNFEIVNSGNILMENYKKNIKNGYLYHMIILEIDMPEINGLWCAQKIRSYEQRYELKQSCIILLINENQTDFDNYSNLGVDHFVDLPINVKRLEDVIEIKLKEINKKNEKIEEKPKSNQIEYFKGFNFNKVIIILYCL